MAARNTFASPVSAVTALRSLVRREELEVELALDVALTGGVLYLRGLLALAEFDSVLDVDEKERAAAASGAVDAEPG